MRTQSDRKSARRPLGEKGLEELRRLVSSWPAPAGPVSALPGDAALEEAVRLCDVPEESRPKLRGLAQALRGSAEAERLLAAAHSVGTRTHAAGAAPCPSVRDWPSLAEEGAPDADLFYFFVLAQELPAALDRYRTRGIPREVIEATLADVGRKLREYREAHGRWGIRGPKFAFLFHCLRGELYQLGRLQFHFASFNGGVRAYRNRMSGAVRALAEPSIRYDAAGRVCDPAAPEGRGEWTSCLWESPDEVAGYPIHPGGFAEEEPVQLAADAWEPVLKPGDPVLHVHIPSGQALEPDACAQSFRQAREFVRRFYPDRPCRAFCCHSWLLDPQLERVLPADSNLVRFQREFYLYPLFEPSESALRFVFGRVPEDLKRAPRDTTLRRRMLEILESGGRWPGGGGFLLPEDLRWGRQVYRRQCG